MLSVAPSMSGQRPPVEAGFTLVELLVAMAAGIAVLMGLISVLIFTLHQTQRTFTKVDATRRARTALAGIENQLHSACVAGPAGAPIQGGSTADSLVFLSFYGTAASPTPIWHQLTFNSTTSTLTDSSYNVAGTGPNWTQGTLVSTQTVLTNVTRQASIPVFQYFAYQPEYTDAAGDVFWTIPDGGNTVPVTGATLPAAPLPTASGLSAANADSVVEVLVNVLVGASSSSLNNPTLTAVSDPVTDAVSLRTTTPPNQVQAGTTAQGYGPCQ